MAITRLLQLTAEVDGSNSMITEPDAYATTTINTTYKKSGAASFDFNNAGGNSYIEKAFAATAQARVGCHVMRAKGNYDHSNQKVIQFMSGGSPAFSLRWNDLTNLYTLYFEGGLQDTGTRKFYPWLSNLNWHHIGIDFKIDGAAGWVYVYIDGVEELSMSGDTLGTYATVDSIRFGFGTNNACKEWYVDDIFVDDTTGEGATAVVPDKRFEHVMPSGNGNTSDMEGSDGNQVDNYALVDEKPHTSDTDYVYATAAAVKDTYAMNTVAVPTGWSIAAVIPTLIARKTGGGDTNQVKTIVRSNVTEAAGSAQDLPTSYGLLWERQTTDPDGAGVWDQAAIDAMEIGQESAGAF